MNDKKTIDKLVSENIGYVVNIAKQYIGRGLELDDLVSEGNYGLIKAAGTFDGSKGTRFVSYAAPFIKESIETVLKKINGTKLSVDEPIPKGSKNTINLLHVLEDPNSEHADNQLLNSANLEDLQKMMAVLDEREQLVISCVYGIGRNKVSMKECGEMYGMKRERVRQVRDKALRKLSRASILLPLL